MGLVGGFSRPENFVFALTTFSQFTALGESLQGPEKDLKKDTKKDLRKGSQKDLKRNPDQTTNNFRNQTGPKKEHQSDDNDTISIRNVDWVRGFPPQSTFGVSQRCGAVRPKSTGYPCDKYAVGVLGFPGLFARTLRVGGSLTCS